MKIAIAGSMSASKEIVNIGKELSSLGYDVTLPRRTSEYAEDILQQETHQESTKNKIKFDRIRKYFEEIKDSDILLVVNTDKNGIKNYIGGNTFLEMGFAHVLNKKIYLYNDIPDLSYTDEIKAMQPIVLKGDLSKIKLL